MGIVWCFGLETPTIWPNMKEAAWCDVIIHTWIIINYRYGPIRTHQFRFTEVKLKSISFHMLPTLPSQWFLAPARLYAYQPLLQFQMFRRIIISIVRVTEHFSKMLVLSGVFNTIILDAANYANQDYIRVNYTLIVAYTMLLLTGSQSKKTSHVFAWIWPTIDRWLVNHCAMPLPWECPMRLCLTEDQRDEKNQAIAEYQNLSWQEPGACRTTLRNITRTLWTCSLFQREVKWNKLDENAISPLRLQRIDSDRRQCKYYIYMNMSAMLSQMKNSWTTLHYRSH
jgi:hypothetical protein